MVEALKKLATRSIEGIEDLSDEILVEMCKKELPTDVTAYRELLRRYESLVYNTCNKIIGSQSDAEEVAQDVMIQVFHKIHQFEGRSKFKTWLYKIVHNYSSNRLSRIIRKREGAEKFENIKKTEEKSQEFKDIQANLSGEVQEAIETLSAKERQILTLKFMSGLTIQEISDVMEIGLSAAKMRLYRAMESFKISYEKIKTP